MLSALPGGPLNKDKLCRARDKSSEMGRKQKQHQKEKKTQQTVHKEWMNRFTKEIM